MTIEKLKKELGISNKDIAEYFGRQFIDIWTDYLLI